VLHCEPTPLPATANTPKHARARTGTEPKIKYYSEIVATAETAEQREAVQKELATAVDSLVEALLQPDVYKLQAKSG